MTKTIMCSVDGCDRESYTQGKPHLCSSHYEQRRKARNAERASRGLGKLCSVVGCGGAHRSGGLCQLHYGRTLRTGSTDAPVRKQPEPVPLNQCGVDECIKLVKSRNALYCTGHQSNLERNGSPVSTNSRNRPPLERVARKLVGNWDTGCWLWTGYLNQDGYGMFRPDHRVIKDVRVHRWLFQELTGVELAAHVQLDHSCQGGTRHCARPGHLYAVTQAEHSINTTARTRAAADGMEYPARQQHQSMDELQFGIAHNLPTVLHDVFSAGVEAGFTAFNFPAENYG